ncbi:SDR family NAD(P)-dependent oxidoreductase [Alteromonas sp. AMM-1]|uniref:SDR family NAD(P)-dependent oxidoreductase n=1 Tax=Alteromonas sp. AMM-1 TaxID=3394233 RepID=UPI0039A51F63
MNVLVVGAGGAIGRAVTEAFCQRYSSAVVYAVSRRAYTGAKPKQVVPVQLDTGNEQAVHDWLSACKAEGTAFTHVVCTTGVLHDSNVAPEKRLEDVSASAMQHYFTVNTLVPALWVKLLVNHLVQGPSTLTVLSARVGSISDNQLGGWYGYRASKAALNMFVKTAAVEYARRAKHTSLICYHPGTVDSALSKPFQRNVKPEKLFTPAYTASQLLQIIEHSNPTESPYFIDWAGKSISW